MTDSRPPAARASATRTMRPSASRSMPTIGCSSRRTRCPAPCTAARTVSTRNGASGTFSSSAVPAGGESIDAHGHRLAARARRRSRRARWSAGRAPRDRTCAGARAACGRAATRAKWIRRSLRGALSRLAISSSSSRRSGCAAWRSLTRSRYPVEPRACRAGGTIAVRASAASSLAPTREAHGDLRDAVGVPAHARQRRVEQARDRLVVEADDGDVGGDAQAELAAGGVDAERDRIREREDRRRALGAAEQIARERLGAVEAVLAGVQLRLEPEPLPTTRARPARRCAPARARSPTRARRCGGGRARRGARARRARRARGRTAPARRWRRPACARRC